jgi:hypothetical protein
MKIFLKTLTGQGLTLQGNLDISELPEDLAQKTKALLNEESLSKATGAEKSPSMVDSQEYELTIFPDDESKQPQRYKFSESEGNVEIAELLDELMYEINLRKMGSSSQSK